MMAAAGALLIFILGILFPAAWMPAGVYHVRPYFSDLFAVLAANDAVAAVHRRSPDFFYTPFW
jgi:hypothetical protein